MVLTVAFDLKLFNALCGARFQEAVSTPLQCSNIPVGQEVNVGRAYCCIAEVSVCKARGIKLILSLINYWELHGGEHPIAEVFMHVHLMFT
jgi:hypothetical protein